MKILDRYILVNVLALTAMAGAALLAIYSFVLFMLDVDEAGQGGFGYRSLLIYTLLQMPAALYLLMPIIAMLGTLLGLGALAAQSELTAMRAVGFSVARIGGSTLIAGAVLAVLVLVLGDWAGPVAQQRGEALRTEAKTGVKAGIGGKPVWLREGDNVFHIRQLIAEDHLASVEIYTLTPDLQLASTTFVREARYGAGGWTFSDVRRTDFSPDSAAISAAAEVRWNGTLDPEVLRLFVLEAKALSLSGLSRLINYLEQNRLDSSSYRLAFWRKIVAPFTVMAMMLIAVPFVFGALRSAGAGQRLLVGVMAGLVFYILNEITANAGQIYALNPFVSAAAPTFVVFVLALWRLRRVT